MNRTLALDVGSKTIGIAISDPMGIFAQPVETLRREGKKKDLARLISIVAERQVGSIVIGLPVRTDGSEGPEAKRARGIGELLSGVLEGVEVLFQDERFTTRQAERVLIQGGVRRGKRKEVIDQMAAVLILQSHLDAASR
ncbi:MAG: Holliday junction resolvase RuvX [Myxococcota bacterium]|nr:Holliday junction resolvase RuvX [Myxococcota bacterium]